MTPITFHYVTSAAGRGRNSSFKTLVAAKKRAHALVGPHPKRDPDGYAVHRVTGNCLFFQGTTFEELFPSSAPENPHA